MASDKWLEDLEGWLAIPSVSADPAHAGDVNAAGQWVCDFVRRAGGECKLVAEPPTGRPLALGRISASRNAETAPTVMVYGHFDVQPPEPLELWDSSPFVATVRDGWLYARGAADNKGQLYMLLRAAADLAAAEELPVNLRICCDGEEEVGGHGVVDFLKADDDELDACVIFDFPMQENKPAFILATRGMIYSHLVVRTGSQDLHSGVFGGVAMNALHALHATLAPVLARDGHVPAPLRAGALAVTEVEAREWAELCPGGKVLRENGATAMDSRADAEFYVRAWSETTVEINGISGGEPHLQKTVLPVEAEANVSIRLAPGQDVDEITGLFERMLRAGLPVGAELAFEVLSSCRPSVVDPASNAIQLGLAAFERTVGTRPRLIRAGGSLPIAAALTDRGIPVIMTGFVGLDANAHSPNERIQLSALELGIATARELFSSLGELS